MQLRILAVVCMCCALLAIGFDIQSSQTEVKRRVAIKPIATITPAAQRRAEEQTFLTFPEWYLVYSPDEYANLVQDRPPSDFPYLEHIAQFWQGYDVMYTATKDEYPFNGGYHMMVMVIGASTTIEYGMKWAYEQVIGRITETTCRGEMTAEDKLAADIAREYADFLDGDAWFNFDYVGAINRLWSDTGFWGPHPLRKWERKYALTTEYAIKVVYAQALKQGAESAYGTVEFVTATLLDGVPPEDMLDEFPDLKIIEQFPDGTVLVELPRYQPFTAYAKGLAARGIGFIEIAGNRNAILVSAVVPDDFEMDVPVLMTQPIITQPGRQRIVFSVPVAQLGATIGNLRASTTNLEHIYDY
ncbi:MAG: hypothetical protein O3C40_11070 [Planctomycetota bacterium]|nr:hypothetical protein [Planctomycetota bacterium]